MAYSLYHPKVSVSELDLSNVDLSGKLESIILDLRPKIEMGKEYSWVAASVLCEILRQETLATLGHTNVQSLSGPEQDKPMPTLREVLTFGVSEGQINERLLSLDIDRLQSEIKFERNSLFDYLGAHTLYDRYLLHKVGKRYEGLQHFWMRVAMGVSLAEADIQKSTDKAVEFYHCISQMFYVPSTPTLFNAGTHRSQMSSCFLTSTQDDLADIYRQFADNAMLSKFAGGLGNDWTNIRASGSWIKGTNGRSQGVIPFLKVQDSSTIAVNQGGKRKGAVCAYLETWHLDIEDFLELRKNTGDERRRTPDMFTANWIPDLFMQRLENDAQWTLFCPAEAPDLHDAYGNDFKKLYESYEAKADNGELKNFKRIPAVQLWRKMLSMLFETGHPWITFKDPCNLRNPQKHVGTVHSSNLCTEITLNTSKDETAVCNIGSVNLKNIFAQPNPAEVLAKSIATAMRMLDNVISENFYPIASAKTANERHRPVGLGVMGLQNLLYRKRVAFARPEALYVSAKIMEHISFHAFKASAQLARERGSYSTFAGSDWSQGKLPQDTLENLGSHVNIPKVPQKFVNGSGEERSVEEILAAEGFALPLAWDQLRPEVRSGMRNSLCLAIAPTATISNIAGCVPSIEPSYKNLFVKTNLGGDYTIINEYLVDDLKRLGYWNAAYARSLKRADGSIAQFDLPQEFKELYQTAFDIEPEQLIRMASVRQVYIDQAQSLNLFISTPSGRRLDEMYRFAWKSGLKTTYYLRSKAATGVEMSSLKTTQFEASAPEPSEVKACSIENPDCESCQ